MATFVFDHKDSRNIQFSQGPWQNKEQKQTNKQPFISDFYLFIYLFIYLFVCLFVYLFIYYGRVASTSPVYLFLNDYPTPGRAVGNCFCFAFVCMYVCLFCFLLFSLYMSGKDLKPMSLSRRWSRAFRMGGRPWGVATAHLLDKG